MIALTETAQSTLADFGALDVRWKPGTRRGSGRGISPFGVRPPASGRRPASTAHSASGDTSPARPTFSADPPTQTPAASPRWQDAEAYTAESLRRFGYKEAAVTPAGPDGGVDVASRRWRMVGQVKHWTSRCTSTRRGVGCLRAIPERGAC